MAKLFTLKNIILFFIAYWLWKNVVSDWIDINWNLPFFGSGSIENYGDTHLHYSSWSGHQLSDCEPEFSTTAQCTQAAHAQCGTSDDRLNNCWMPAFLKCSASAPNTPAGLANTNCHAYANSYCGGSPGECADCFSKVHQSCMASKGLAKSC